MTTTHRSARRGLRTAEDRLLRVLLFLSRLVFPAHCAFCDALLPFAVRGVCPDCRKRMVRPHRLALPDGFAVFSYDGVVRDALHRMKYRGRPEYAAFFADCLAMVGEEEIRRWAPAVMIPVPIHPARRRMRGYNQAEELTCILSRRLGIPQSSRLVVRQKETQPQNALTPAERRENVRDAFAVRRPVPARVLLVDDIYTTGSTVRELTQLLKTHGAVDVRILCVAVAESTRMCYNDSV